MDYCPEFNTGARVLDTVPCNVTKGCPNVTFLSSEVYQYPVCLNKTHREEFSAHGQYSLRWFWIVGPLLLGIVLLALAVAGYFSIRERKGQKTNGTCPQLEEREPFFKTAAFHEATQYLKEGGNFLVLSGIWGSGKTKTAQEVYRLVTGKSPTIITGLENFDYEEQNEALIFEEAIPTDLSKEEMKKLQDKINTWFERVSVNETNPFIIFTSNDDRQSDFSKIIPVSSGTDLKFINLNDRLTKGDRTQILISHFTLLCSNTEFSKIEGLAINGINKSLGYPEICALFCRCEHFQKEEIIFCSRPLRSLRSYLENMCHSEENKFLILVYMSLNQMEMDMENLDEMLFNELETCKKYNTTQAEPLVGTIIDIFQHGNVEDIQSLMSWEFVNKVPYSNKYRLQHEVIKRMTLIVFGTFHFNKLLELTKREDLEGWIKKSSFYEIMRSFHDDMMPFLFIKRQKWLQYEQKMG